MSTTPVTPDPKQQADTKSEPPKPYTKEFDLPPPSDWTTETVKIDKHQNPWAVMIDYIKTVITLASAILGFSVTFVNALVGTAPNRTTIHRVEWAWGLLIVTIAAALWAVGIITSYLRCKRPTTTPATLLCNIAYFALFLALVFFARAGASRLSQLTNAPQPKPQPISYLKKLGEIGSFDSGLASLCDPKITDEQCEARLKSAFEPLPVAQLPNVPGFLILVGSADRERLTPSALRIYGSNAGLARGRCEWVQQELVKRFPQALGNARFISLYTGPNPFANAFQPKSEPDRRVEIWAGSTSGD